MNVAFGSAIVRGSAMYQHEENKQPMTDSQGSETSTTAARQSGLLRCAHCGQKFDMATSPCKPFCSIRCQRIDLGNWLNESYGLPYEGEGVREFREDNEEEA